TGNTCRKLAAGKRVVKLALKPDTELGDLIAWISSVTCRQFLLPGSIDPHGKNVTIIAPQLTTPEQAYRLFPGARDPAGLQVVPQVKCLRVVETSTVRTHPVPVYVGNAKTPLPVGEPDTDSRHAEQEHGEKGEAGSRAGQERVDRGGRVRP